MDRREGKLDRFHATKLTSQGEKMQDSCVITARPANKCLEVKEPIILVCSE
jgi:hypothetical protein